MEKPGKDREGNPAPIRMQKDYRIVPRGISLVIGCNTFPTWNAYPGIFASLATGNPVVIKPHPRAVLPLAITVDAARKVLAEAGSTRRSSRLAAEADGRGLANARRARRDRDHRLHGRAGLRGVARGAGAALGRLVYTEKAGLNTVVIDSTDNLKGMLGNLAFSLTLYSGQMCTAPQNIYVPSTGVETDEGHLSFDEFGERLATARCPA